MDNTVIKQLEEEENQRIMDLVTVNKKTTYISIGSEDTGILDIDLVTFRQKNDEMRYLSIGFKGIDVKTGDVQNAFINIDDENVFKELKSFFNQLEWNS